MLARTMPAAAFSANTRKLPVQEAMSLYDALDTIFNVVAGLRCQPRFERDDSEAGAAQAGDELEDIADAIAGRLTELIDEIRAASPSEPFFQRRRAEFLLRHAIGNDLRVSDVATAAVRAVFQDRF